MINIVKKIIVIFSITVAMSTTVRAASSSYADQIDAEIRAWDAQRQMNSQIVQRNKAAYDAIATPLQKKVDALIARSDKGDTTAVTELVALMNSTPDWSCNIQVPLTASLPPRAVLVKTGYRFDDETIWEGDTRPFIWVIEDGELCACNLSNLAWTTQSGGFHESVNKILNHQVEGLGYH